MFDLAGGGGPQGLVGLGRGKELEGLAEKKNWEIQILVLKMAYLN